MIKLTNKSFLLISLGATIETFSRIIINDNIDLNFHLGFYDYNIDDDETDYGLSIDFQSGFSFGIIDSSRDDSNPFFIISYSLNRDEE